jgi:hypothetical protein
MFCSSLGQFNKHFTCVAHNKLVRFLNSAFGMQVLTTVAYYATTMLANMLMKSAMAKEKKLEYFSISSISV